MSCTSGVQCSWITLSFVLPRVSLPSRELCKCIEAWNPIRVLGDICSAFCKSWPASIPTFGWLWDWPESNCFGWSFVSSKGSSSECSWMWCGSFVTRNSFLTVLSSYFVGMFLSSGIVSLIWIDWFSDVIVCFSILDFLTGPLAC